MLRASKRKFTSRCEFNVKNCKLCFCTVWPIAPFGASESKLTLEECWSLGFMNWQLWEVHAFKDIPCHPLGYMYTERCIWEVHYRKKCFSYKKLKVLFFPNLKKPLMYKSNRYVGWGNGKSTKSLKECGCPGTSKALLLFPCKSLIFF